MTKHETPHSTCEHGNCREHRFDECLKQKISQSRENHPLFKQVFILVSRADQKNFDQHPEDAMSYREATDAILNLMDKAK